MRTFAKSTYSEENATNAISSRETHGRRSIPQSGHESFDDTTSVKRRRAVLQPRLADSVEHGGLNVPRAELISALSELHENSVPRLRDDVVRNIVNDTNFLILYGGYKRLHGEGLGDYLAAWGVRSEVIDIERSRDHDFADEATWMYYRRRLEDDVYESASCQTPCRTFSKVLSQPGSVRPLRGEWAPEIYGFDDLTPLEKEKVRVGTLHALRSFFVLNHMLQSMKSAWLETPMRSDGQPSVLKLPPMLALLTKPNVHVHTLIQCPFGASTTKPTDLLLVNLWFNSSEEHCPHPKILWKRPWDGAEYYGAHPPLSGRQWYVPAEKWLPSMLRRQEPRGPYISASAAAYPGPMNKWLADQWVRGVALLSLRTSQAASMITSSSLIRRPEDGRFEKVTYSQGSSQSPTGGLDMPATVSGGPVTAHPTPLRGNSRSLLPPLMDESLCVGGLKEAWKACRKLWMHRALGLELKALIETYLDKAPQLIDDLNNLIGAPDASIGHLEPHIDAVRNIFAEHFSRRLGRTVSCEPVSGEYSTQLRGDFMQAWAETAKDPALKVVSWLSEGTPAGISVPFDALDGLTPQVNEEAELDYDSLQADEETFVNYKGVDQDPDAIEAISTYISKGYLQSHDSWESVCKELGHEPVLSKVGVVKRKKVDHLTKEVTEKTRIIVDSKESKVTAASKRSHRTVLPGIIHAVFGILGFFVTSSDGHSCEDIEVAVIDVKDAFWLPPLHQNEKRFFVIKWLGKFLVFLRTAQGSRGGPLSWCALAAVATRNVQSLLATPSGEEARINTYVDDPLVALKGSPKRRRRLMAIFLLGWLVQGFPMAFQKARKSFSLVWIGALIRIVREGVQVEIPEEKITELIEETARMLSKNVVAKKFLRSYIGKTMNIAGIIVMWRPFLMQLWAALYAETDAPPGCVWLKQIQISLKWIMSFLTRQHGTLLRLYRHKVFLRHTKKLTIVTDASPWGLGGWIAEDDIVVSYFSSAISSLDCEILGHVVGSHEGQQAFEGLAALVALRLWKHKWTSDRLLLEVKSDNLAVLSLVSSLKVSGHALGIVAREFALEMADGAFFPDVVSQLPGVANISADGLSRKWDPSKHDRWVLPTALSDATECLAPARDRSWWITL